LPEFSVIMPVWNRANIFSRAMESVLIQTFMDYEVIIINDGSDDDLDKIVKPYVSQKVKYFKIKHKGQPGARNEALSRASGRFIAYLDSDNEWYPEFLEEMHNALKSAKSKTSAAYCMIKLICKKNDGSIKISEKVGESFNFEKLLEKNFMDINSFVHSRECLEYAGLFDENLKRLVDWDFIIRVARPIKPVFVKKVLLNYYKSFFANCISLTGNYEQSVAFIKNKYKGLAKPKKKTIFAQVFPHLTR